MWGCNECVVILIKLIFFFAKALHLRIVVIWWNNEYILQDTSAAVLTCINWSAFCRSIYEHCANATVLC